MAESQPLQNQLGAEESVYLKQHQHNPIHWQSFNENSLQLAKERDRPILLSIGYSTCHWCHVMATETFSDTATANFLNQHFICIKVDREEHPELDQFFQKACLHFTGAGGWPLNAFTTPELKPFFLGTYYPVQARQDMPSFLELINHIQLAYQQRTEEVKQEAEKLFKQAHQVLKIEKPVEFKGHFPAPEAILKALAPHRDQENGGYGQAPKFPLFSFYEWALEAMMENLVQQQQGVHILNSLESMLMGGVYDQVRGGIHRYSTDDKWQVPHFEKMLYDQSGLLRVLIKASSVYASALIFDALIQTLHYLEVEMLSENGYFFSAQDADSEGEEGLYFTFTKQEFISILEGFSEKQQQSIMSWFTLTEQGNYRRGLNTITLNPRHRQEYHQKESWELIRQVRQALWQERKKRLPPMTDNKGVASWNFMLISALCDVIQYARLDAIQKQALRLLNQSMEKMQQQFLLAHEPQTQGVINRFRLRHSTTLNNKIPYLEDYVFFAESQLRVYEVTANPIFKGNGLKTLDFIYEQFLDSNERLYTQSLKDSKQNAVYNLQAPLFDQSFRSPVATFLLLIKKWHFFLDEKFLKLQKTMTEQLTQHPLQNPLAHGEAMRALNYPLTAYRKLEMPVRWLKEIPLNSFMPFFSGRFVFDYHHREDDKWQICSQNQCDAQGDGFKQLQALFQPEGEP